MSEIGDATALIETDVSGQNLDNTVEQEVDQELVSAANRVMVAGQVMEELPKDLYIPPDALCVFLETFSGPLDLLLYLIKKQNLNILDIPIVEITRQYVNYIEIMQLMQLELAADYLVMAAFLAEVKSRMLLPRNDEELEDEIDPRAELIRRLQEYERFKQAAEDLDNTPRMFRDTYRAKIPIERIVVEQRPDIELEELTRLFAKILQRAELKGGTHTIQKEILSVRERMSIILNAVDENNFLPFEAFFDLSEGKMGVVVTFLAILELVKESLLELVQVESYGQIHVKAVA